MLPPDSGFQLVFHGVLGTLRGVKRVTLIEVVTRGTFCGNQAEIKTVSAFLIMFNNNNKMCSL